MKIQKKINVFMFLRGGGGGGGGQGGCEWRSEAFVKIQIKKFEGGWGLGSGGGGVRLGGSGWGGVQAGREQRSEACVEIQKKKLFFFWVGVRVDVNGEVKLL